MSHLLPKAGRVIPNAPRTSPIGASRSGTIKPLAIAGVLFLCLTGGLAAADARLADAVEKQDRAGITALLDQKIDVSAPQVDGMTALHWAVYQDNLDLAKRLVTAGANVKAENRYGVTVLSLACTNGNGAIVELLLGAGADVNKALSGGETPLLTAARTGKVGPVKALLARGAKVDGKDLKGQTPLMWAAADGNLAVVDELIAAGADFRAKLDSGFTPLFFAIREGRIPVVQRLLKAGLDINEPMQSKRAGAGRGGRSGTMTPLALAVDNAHFELAVALLEAGADPTDQRSGFTPLHQIVTARKPGSGDGANSLAPMGSGTVTSLQFVRQLVAHGADVNAQLERGTAASPGVLGRKGATPFLLAAQTADIPLMKLLLQLGANPKLTNADHSTPLLAAAGVGTRAPGEEAATEDEALEAVQICLAHGNDINAVDDNGMSAMHGAAYASFPRMAHFLAAHGAKIDIWYQKDKIGWTPLLVAEGHRQGNFKPGFEVLAAIREIMVANGMTVPAPTPYKPVRGYGL